MCCHDNQRAVRPVDVSNGSRYYYCGLLLSLIVAALSLVGDWRIRPAALWRHHEHKSSDFTPLRRAHYVNGVQLGVQPPNALKKKAVGWKAGLRSFMR